MKVDRSEFANYISIGHCGEVHEGLPECSVAAIEVLADCSDGSVSHSELNNTGVEAFELVPVLSGGGVETPCCRESASHHPAPVVQVAPGDFPEEERVAGAVRDVTEIDFEVTSTEDALVLSP